jgi:hypothetical protein
MMAKQKEEQQELPLEDEQPEVTPEPLDPNVVLAGASEPGVIPPSERR